MNKDLYSIIQERSDALDSARLSTIAMREIAHCHQNLGHFVTALSKFAKCESIQLKDLGEDHPEYGATLYARARCLRDMG